MLPDNGMLNKWPFQKKTFFLAKDFYRPVLRIGAIGGIGAFIPNDEIFSLMRSTPFDYKHSYTLNTIYCSVVLLH